MHLLIDMGNSRTKWMTADDRWSLGAEGVYEGSWESVPQIEQCSDALLCATGRRDAELDELKARGIDVDIATRLFFASLHADAEHHSLYFPTIVYHDAEHTLGHDRILALCGARSLTQEACLVVDAGTCITADYMSSDGLFAGGAIMASPEMQLHAMHSYTAHLPLPDIDYQHRYTSPCGTSTASAMLAGTVATTAMALRAVADYYQRQHSTPVRILCTGGDGWFISQMVDGAQYIDNLVFRGMAMIGRHAIAGTAQH